MTQAPQIVVDGKIRHFYKRVMWAVRFTISVIGLLVEKREIENKQAEGYRCVLRQALSSSFNRRLFLHSQRERPFHTRHGGDRRHKAITNSRCAGAQQPMRHGQSTARQSICLHVSNAAALTRSRRVQCLFTRRHDNRTHLLAPADRLTSSPTYLSRRRMALVLHAILHALRISSSSLKRSVTRQDRRMERFVDFVLINLQGLKYSWKATVEQCRVNCALIQTSRC